LVAVGDPISIQTFPSTDEAAWCGEFEARP
jgi:hypothetical protein